MFSHRIDIFGMFVTNPANNIISRPRNARNILDITTFYILKSLFLKY